MRRKGGWSRIPGEVRFYAGYRGQEEPKRVILQGCVYPVTSILARERVEGGVPGRRLEVFLCRVGRGAIEIRVREDGTTEIFAKKSGKGKNGA